MRVESPIRRGSYYTALYFTLLALFTPSAYCEFTPGANRGYLFDITFFQANLGWANFTAQDHSTSTLSPNLDFNSTFKGSGGHGALSVVDLNRLSRCWLMGGRFGGQYSNVQGTIETPTHPALEPLTQTYELHRQAGVFADAMVVAAVREETKSSSHRPYTYGFVGAAYDDYKLSGFQQVPPFFPNPIRLMSIWGVSARAGVGAGIRFLDRYAVGLEYTHTFGPTFSVNALSNFFPGEDRSHSIQISGNAIDLTFAVLLQ